MVTMRMLIASRFTAAVLLLTIPCGYACQRQRHPARISLTADTVSGLWRDTANSKPFLLHPSEIAQLFGWVPLEQPAVGDLGSAELRAWFNPAITPPHGVLRLVATDSGVQSERWVYWEAEPFPAVPGCWTPGPRPRPQRCPPAESARMVSELRERLRQQGEVFTHAFRCQRVQRVGPLAGCRVPALGADEATVLFGSLDSLRIWNLPVVPWDSRWTDGMEIEFEMRVGPRHRAVAFNNPQHGDSANAAALAALRLVERSLSSAARGGSWKFWEMQFGAPPPRW
jgi:hypothetical protein